MYLTDTSRKIDIEKVPFYDEVASEWELGNSSEIIFSKGYYNGHMGKCVEVFEGVYGGIKLRKKLWKKKDY